MGAPRQSIPAPDASGAAPPSAPTSVTQSSAGKVTTGPSIEAPCRTGGSKATPPLVPDAYEDVLDVFVSGSRACVETFVARATALNAPSLIVAFNSQALRDGRDARHTPAAPAVIVPPTHHGGGEHGTPVLAGLKDVAAPLGRLTTSVTACCGAEVGPPHISPITTGAAGNREVTQGYAPPHGPVARADIRAVPSSQGPQVTRVCALFQRRRLGVFPRTYSRKGPVTRAARAPRSAPCRPKTALNGTPLRQAAVLGGPCAAVGLRTTAETKLRDEQAMRLVLDRAPNKAAAPTPWGACRVSSTKTAVVSPVLRYTAPVLLSTTTLIVGGSITV